MSPHPTGSVKLEPMSPAGQQQQQSPQGLSQLEAQMHSFKLEPNDSSSDYLYSSLPTSPLSQPVSFTPPMSPFQNPVNTSFTTPSFQTAPQSPQPFNHFAPASPYRHPFNTPHQHQPPASPYHNLPGSPMPPISPLQEPIFNIQSPPVSPFRQPPGSPYQQQQLVSPYSSQPSSPGGMFAPASPSHDPRHHNPQSPNYTNPIL